MADSDDFFEISALIQQQAEAFERLAERARQGGREDADGNSWVSRKEFDAYVDAVTEHARTSRALSSAIIDDQSKIVTLTGNLARILSLLAQSTTVHPNMEDKIPDLAFEVSNTAFEHAQRLSARAAQLGPIPSSGE